MSKVIWASLEEPWQACLEEAWAAYCAGSLPIGAVVVDGEGEVISRARNRIFSERSEISAVRNLKLMHAELQALLALDEGAIPKDKAVLYTTMEPCPLCLGAWYMSDLIGLHFATRDLYAGSTNLLETSWYMRSKAREVAGPHKTLEPLLLAMHVEFEVRLGRGSGIHIQRWRDELQDAVEFGEELAKAGTLMQMMEEELTVDVVIDRLAEMYANGDV